MAIFINDGDVTNPNNVGQFGATEASIGAYKQAGEYAQDAEYWAKLSEKNINTIDDLLVVVEELLKQGVLLEKDIEDLKDDFAAQDARLTQLISQTNAAIDGANNAIDAMNLQMIEVQKQLDILMAMYVTVETLPSGSSATGTFNATTGEFHFGIPEGAPGSVTDLNNAPQGVPDPTDWGFYVESTDNTVHRALMSDIAKTFPSVTSVAQGSGAAEQGDVVITAAKLGLGNVLNVPSYSKTESDAISTGYVKTYESKSDADADAKNRKVGESVLVWNNLTYDFYDVIAGTTGQPNKLSASTTKTEKRIITVNQKEPDSTGNIDITIPTGNQSLYLGEMLLFPYDPNKPITYQGIKPANGGLISKADAIDLGPSLVSGQLPVVSETAWQAGAKHYFSWGKLADGTTDADSTNYINIRLPDWTDGTAMRSPSATGDTSYAGQEQVQIPYITMVNGVAPVEADGKVVVPFSTFLSYILKNNAVLQGTNSSGETKNLIGLDSAGSVSVGDPSVPVTVKSSTLAQVSDGISTGKIYSELNKPSLGDLGAAKSGDNSDITSLSSLTSITSNVNISGATNFTVIPKTITPVGDTDIPNKKYVDDAIAATGNKGSGGYLGQVLWHDNRSKPADGTVTADGQEVDQVGPFADLYADVLAGNRPTVTEAEWQSTPSKRGCYVANSSTGKMRLPDYNGVQTGSIKSPVLRGDSATLTTGFIQTGGVPNVKGEIAGVADDTAPLWANAILTPPFTVEPRGGTGNKPMGYAPSNSPSAANDRPLGIDLSTSSNMYQNGLTEVRMNSIVGCYVIRYAASAQNAGSLDAMTLSTRIESVNTDLQAKVITTNNRIGYSLIDVGTPALGSGQILVNPFGNNTPVICEVQALHPTLNKWITIEWQWFADNKISGARCFYSEGEGLVFKMAPNSVVERSDVSGFSAGSTNVAGISAPTSIRVHVRKILS